MSTGAVIGYTWRAETYCPLDLVMSMAATGVLTVDILADASMETVLDDQARVVGIDRNAEHSFDSWQFPKVIVSGSCGEDAYCDRCMRRLGD